MKIKQNHFSWNVPICIHLSFRTILLYEHSDLVVIAFAGAVFSGGAPSKVSVRHRFR